MCRYYYYVSMVPGARERERELIQLNRMIMIIIIVIERSSIDVSLVAGTYAHKREREESIQLHCLPTKHELVALSLPHDLPAPHSRKEQRHR